MPQVLPIFGGMMSVYGGKDEYNQDQVRKAMQDIANTLPEIRDVLKQIFVSLEKARMEGKRG